MVYVRMVPPERLNLLPRYIQRPAIVRTALQRLHNSMRILK